MQTRLKTAATVLGQIPRFMIVWGPSDVKLPLRRSGSRSVFPVVLPFRGFPKNHCLVKLSLHRRNDGQISLISSRAPLRSHA